MLFLVLYISVYKVCSDMDVQNCGSKYSFFWKLLEKGSHFPK